MKDRAYSILNRGKSGGFTLVEMMVVVVLIGIMAAAIIPEMRGTFEDALLRSTGREMIDAFSLANTRAVSLNQTHRVRFNTPGGEYFIERPSRAGEQPPGYVTARELPGSEGKLDQRIRIKVLSQTDDAAPEDEVNAGVADQGASGDAAGVGDIISFYADGTADAREILLRDRQGFRLALRINPTTARVNAVKMGRE